MEMRVSSPVNGRYLPPPARYFPPASGRYEVAPNLRPLWTTDYGNGERDGFLLQFDTEFPRFRDNRLTCRAERFSKYVCTHDFDTPAQEAVARLLVERLRTDHPHLFHVETLPGGETLLSCRLTGETLRFDAAMRLTGAEPGINPPYADAFDALCCQIPEDIAVVRTEPGRGDWIAALHLCAPSRWAGEEKIGRDFIATHAPVPGMEKVSAAAPSLVAAMVGRGPFVRFTWGIEFDERLNRHPEPPPGVDAEEWNRRGFGPDKRLLLRVERQVLWPLPEANAAVFAIRIYHIDGEEIRADRDEREALRAALRSMSPESRRYKSLDGCFDDVLRWLEEQPSA